MNTPLHAMLRWLMPAALSISVVATQAESVRAAKADSSCVHFSGAAEGEFISLSGRGTVGGTLPLTLCELEPGTSYRILVNGPGFERRVGKFSIDGSGAPTVRGIRINAVLRAVVFPGWGSVYAGWGEAGAADGLGLAASLVILGQEELEYRHLRNRLDVLEKRIDESDSYADRAGFQAAAHQTSREINTQNSHRERLVILSGSLYAWQLLEPLLWANPPRCSTASTKNEMTVAGVREFRSKAFLFSLVRPGSGQFYQGKTMRGLFFSATTLAAGLVALDYQNRYERAIDDYEFSVERFDASEVVSEKERLRREASQLWSGVERERDWRNVSLAVLAGLWAWSLVDTMLPGAAEVPESRYSFDIDARQASLALRF